MSRNTGTFNFAANFEGLLKAPIDAKQLVGTYADLTNPATWNASGSVWLYNGAIVAVGSDPTPANNGIYYLCDAVNYTMTCAWVKAGTGVATGTVSGATNGLRLIDSGTTVVLGGNLTSGTTINGQGLYDLRIDDVTGFQVSGGTTGLIIEPAGITLSYSGTSVNLDSDAGLTYSGDYSANYTPRSLVDAGFVTGLTGTYLKLDQTTPQNVCYGQPTFHEGLIIDEFPMPSMVTGHTAGRMFYDPIYETLSVQIGHPDICGHGVTLQLGQEDLRLVWNATGGIIQNGAVVRSIGTHCGMGVCADVTEVCLAKADTMACALAIGVATQTMSASTYGYITTRGYVSDLNTVTGIYSGITAGSLVYLSPTIAGGVTDVIPSSPNIQVAIGRLATTGATNGKLSTQIEIIYSLNDLSDVVAPSPSLDNVLKWNGLCWVNGTVGSVSASNGVNFYYATPVINSRTQPVGLSQDGTIGNGVQVMSLSKTPVTTGGTQYVCALANGDTRAAVAWLYNSPIGRTVIDSGSWDFTAWLCVDAAGGTTTITNNMYQVVPVTGSTITTSGATANARRADITSSQFGGAYFSASTVNTNASWLQTPSGIYQICAKVDNNRVCIVVPTGYANETSVTGNTWNKLFGVASPDIDTLTYTCCTITLAEPAFGISCTDKLGRIGFLSTTASHTVNVTYNGTTQASFIKTPLITLHNDLAGLQGGSANERYHTTQAQNALLAGITASAAEINVLDGIPPTLTSTELGYLDNVTSDVQAQLDSKLNKSTFTGYTASTATIINNAITGVTNCGGGQTVCNGAITGHNLCLSTIKGSGGTTVQKIGSEIIVCSNTTSGGQQYSGQTPSAVNLCGITIGYQLTGKTVSCILQDLLVPELFGTITPPSTSIGLTCSGIKEIGTVISQTVSGTFSRGSISPQYMSASAFRSGCANAYCFTGAGMPSGWQACALTPGTYNNPSYTVISGTQTWGVCTRFDSGSTAMGSKGTPYGSPPALPSGNTSAVSNTITGILPWFWGTSASGTINASMITGGTCTLAVVGASTPITYNATTQYLWFAAPTGTYTTKTKWWVCAANAGNIGGTGELWKQQGTVAVTCGSKWVGCSFDVYVTCGITTTAAGIPMCLYY